MLCEDSADVLVQLELLRDYLRLVQAANEPLFQEVTQFSERAVGHLGDFKRTICRNKRVHELHRAL